MHRRLTACVLAAAGVLVLASGSPASAVSLRGLSVQQLAANVRYSATVVPTAGQTSCPVALTAELVRARPGRAPWVLRRATSTTDVCVTGEGGVSFTSVRVRGLLDNQGLAGGRYVVRLRADAAGPGGAPVSDTASRRTLLRVLVIRPTRVRRGGRLTLSGAGWPVRAVVLLAVGRPRTSPGDTIARVRTSRRGTFLRRVRISRRAPRGSFVGIAILRNGEKSSARFRIV